MNVAVVTSYKGWVVDLYIYFNSRLLRSRESLFFSYNFFRFGPVYKMKAVENPSKILFFSHISKTIQSNEMLKFSRTSSNFTVMTNSFHECNRNSKCLIVIKKIRYDSIKYLLIRNNWRNSYNWNYTIPPTHSLQLIVLEVYLKRW